MPENYLKEISRYNLRKQNPDPKRCALLVIDMQKYFSSVAEPIMDNLISLISACRKKNIKIIYTRHGHRGISQDGGMLYSWWGDLILYGSKDWNLLPDLSFLENETVLDKNRYSAFYSTDLESILTQSNISELIIAGVLTNCCCETTARDAFVRDFRVFFVSDATATVNSDLHLSSLKNLAFGFAHILSTKELCLFLQA